MDCREWSCGHFDAKINFIAPIVFKKNTILVNQFGWYKILMAKTQCVLSHYCTSFHEITYKGTNTCGCGLCRFMQICTNAVAFFRIIRILIYAVYADMCIMRMSFPNCIYVSTYTNIYKHLYFKTDFWVSYHHLPEWTLTICIINVFKVINPIRWHILVDFS